MTAPEEVGRRLLAACLLGAVLGVWYGFLRPLRPKHTMLCDGAFLAAAVWAWLELMFGVCRGDLRVGALLAMLLSAVVLDLTVGRFLYPVFRLFWGFWIRVMEILWIPWKKFGKLQKIYCHTEKNGLQ